MSIDRKNIKNNGVSGGLKNVNYDLKDKKVNVPDMPEMRRKKKFSDTPFGRTILLRNKTGKTIAGVVTTAITLITGFDLSPILNLTGNNMDILADFGLIELLITGAAFLLVAGVSWLGAYYKLPKVFTGNVKKFIHVAADEIKKATDDKSEGGEKITRNEIYTALITAFKNIFNVNPEELKSAK